jgi:hypothetical protein
MEYAVMLKTIEDFLGMTPTIQDERGFVWYYENGFILLETNTKSLLFVDIDEQIDLKTHYALCFLCNVYGFRAERYTMVDDEPKKISPIR